MAARNSVVPRPERFELRLTTEEADAWRAAAERAHMTFAEWVRVQCNAVVDLDTRSRAPRASAPMPRAAAKRRAA
jgi:hypothetical protein